MLITTNLKKRSNKKDRVKYKTLSLGMKFARCQLRMSLLILTYLAIEVVMINTTTLKKKTYLRTHRIRKLSLISLVIILEPTNPVPL